MTSADRSVTRISPPHRFCIAPMMEWTDRHCRYFLRQSSHHCLLYTEMMTTAALLHGNPGRLLQFDPAEHPVALQLGGSQPDELAEAARIGEAHGYDEINLNLGCPSDRVQFGRFGACLMAEPERVATCITAMRRAVALPVSVKTRIGIDAQDSYEHLYRFVDRLAQAGCSTFIVHARKAILTGLSPKENRNIPELKYDYVYRLKQDFPVLEIILNGGVSNLDDATAQLGHVDGIMLGREAYHNPYLLAEVDGRFFNDNHPLPTRAGIVQRMLPYIERELQAGAELKHITRHMLGLFQGVPGARAWRRHLSHHGPRAGAGTEVILAALEAVAEVGARDHDSAEIMQHHA
ncbi:MAG: tRNA dihydrouridine(20/20a) synthase DusA [Gammaproteobacteria bacterium]|nr:tRNA dihydrouridine(20/20a) synthase DusA [Gammaproteobacteria bacterium]